MAFETLPSLDDVIKQVERDKNPTADHDKSAPEELPPPLDGESREAVARIVDGDGQEVKAAAAVPAEPAEQPKKDPMASRFAAIARREKEFRAEKQAFERRAQDMEQRMKQIEEREQKIGSAKRPTEILKAHGFSYQDATQDVLGAYQEPERDPLDVKLEEKLTPIDARMKSLDEKIAQYEKALADIQSERSQAAARELQSSIRDAAKTGGFELIVEVGDAAYGLVQDVMVEYAKKHNKVLNYDEACDIVEKYYESFAEKFASTQKIKSRFAAPQPAPTQKSPVQKSEAKESPKTLTNSLSQASRAKPNVDEMSKQDALAYLATQLRFND